MTLRSRHSGRMLIGWIILSAAIATPLSGLSQAGDTIPQYGYRVTAKLPQPRENFVQGLQILDGQIYVSTGLRGQSRLLRYRLSDGSLIDGRPVDSRLFAEGLTVLGQRIYQLTWTSGYVLVYNKSDLQGIEYFRIPGQGWGLTHNGKDLIYSDGSHRLHYLSPQSKTITHSIEVMENGLPVPALNELEWIDGQIWANVFKTDRIVVINPTTGEVTASINLHGLFPAEQRGELQDFLNGIAQNPDDKSIWVTGKRWPWIYQIELLETPLPAKQSQAPDAESR